MFTLFKSRTIRFGVFEWDEKKSQENFKKHKIEFFDAISVFLDPHLVIAMDELHSERESRFFAVGAIENKVVTVRFTYRQNLVRIFGAGFWRKGKRLYEKEKRKKKN